MFDTLLSAFQFIHYPVLYLNTSKFFAAAIVLILNIASKYVTIQFSPTTDEYLKAFPKQILVFAMAWMGSRDIYTSLIVLAIFTLISDVLLNDESPYCAIPEKYRIMAKALDTNKDGKVSEDEIMEAIAILDRAKRQKKQQQDFSTLATYYEYLNVADDSGSSSL